MKKIYAKIGESSQTYAHECPAYHIEMQISRPDGDYVAAADGTWVVRELTVAELKLQGVLFEGVMCSATGEDQHGLSDIEQMVLAGYTINFHFENGTIKAFTTANWAAFRAVWIPFRMSFF